MTSRVLEHVAAPVTPRVPAMTVLPVALATVNLLVLMSKSPSIPVAPVTSRVLESVAAPVTPRVLPQVVAPVTSRVPTIAVFPLLSTVNLSVATVNEVAILISCASLALVTPKSLIRKASDEISIVDSSTETFIVFSALVRPSPAVICPRAVNCVNARSCWPTVSLPESVVHTNPISALTVPC